MSDNNEQAAQEFEPVFRLEILMDIHGNVRLEGHVENLRVAYGAIELAKDSLRRYHMMKRESKIVVPDTPLPPEFGGGRQH